MFTHAKAVKGWDYITGDTGEGKGKQSYRNRKIRTNRAVCYCPKEEYVRMSNCPFKNGRKNSLHHHALASGEAKKKMTWISMSDRLWNIGWEGTTGSQAEVMGLPLKDGSASSRCFRKSCWNHCDCCHESLFTEPDTLLLQHRKFFIACLLKLLWFI